MTGTGRTWTSVTFGVVMSLFMGRTAVAQSCPAGKTCFYGPPLIEADQGGFYGDMTLMSPSADANVTYQFGTQSPNTVLVPVGVPVSIPIPWGVAEDPNFDEFGNFGTYLISDQSDLLMEQRMLEEFNMSSATIKPDFGALGKRFRVAGFDMLYDNGDPNNSGYDYLAFYAPTDANIYINPPPTQTQMWENTTDQNLVVHMQARQTYIVRTFHISPDTNDCPNHSGLLGCEGQTINGTLVTSDAPISAVVGGRGWANNAGDDGADGLLPMLFLGNQYVVSNYPGSVQDVRIVADSPNTVVSVDQSQVAVLNPGDTYIFTPYQPTHVIDTSLPVAVFQNASYDGNGDADIAAIPPIAFATLPSLTVAFNVFDPNGRYPETQSAFVSILLPTTALGSLTLDGNALTPSSPDTTFNGVSQHNEWTVVQVSNVAAGNHVVHAASDMQVGMVSQSVFPGAGGVSGLFGYYNPFRRPGCGNGIVASTEECDDGNTQNGDGCSAMCLVEPGYSCHGQPSICAQGCGNGHLDSGEICDDGNNADGDGCTSYCTVEAGWNCVTETTYPASVCNCTADFGCGMGRYCNTLPTSSICTGDLPSGASIPSDHGVCGSSAGAVGGPGDVCSSGQCNASTNQCAQNPNTQCTANSDCSSNVCFSDNLCGYALGGSCIAGSAGNAAENCRSGLCSQAGECLPTDPLFCYVDSDCSAGFACSVANNQCRHTNGYTNCGNANDCVSGVCDSNNTTCGYIPGTGSCTASNANTQCFLGVCSSATLVCVGPGGCTADVDCSSGQYCLNGTVTVNNIGTSALTCQPQRGNGAALVNDSMPLSGGAVRDGNCTTPQVASATCASGLCNAVYNTCAGANGATCSSAADCVANICGSNGRCGYASGTGACTSNDTSLCQTTLCGANGLCGAFNGDACVSNADCQSAACGADGSCGYVVGQGPCTSSNGQQVCRSQYCDSSGTCAAPGVGCGSDTDCPGGFFCDGTLLFCVPQLSPGGTLPNDALHKGCTVSSALAVCLSGSCNDATNTCGLVNGLACANPNQCVSNICGANGMCGLANGQSTCTADNANQVCQSQRCSADGSCVALTGCLVDADCASHQWCDSSSGTCNAQVASGNTLPQIAGQSLNCTANNANVVCSSGLCNGVAGTCAVANNTACTSASQCASNVCSDDGMCGLANSAVCSSDSACRSGSCGSGHCGDPTAYFSGQGLFSCAATHGPTSARDAAGLGEVLLDFGLVLLWARRRRRLAIAAGAVSVLLLGAPARAAETGFALDAIKPAEAGSRFFTAESLVTTPGLIDPSLGDGPRSLTVRLDFDYDHHPLVLRLGDNAVSTPVVANQLVGTLAAGMFVIPHLRINAALPVQWYGDGSAAYGGGYAVLPPYQPVAFGDIRVGATYVWQGEAEVPSFGITARLGIPSGARDSYMGDGGVSGTLLASVAGEASALVYSASLGGRIQPTAHFAGYTVGSELLATLAVGLQTPDRNVLGTLEFPMSTVIVAPKPFSGQYAFVDPLLAIHWWPVQQVGLRAAFSTSLTNAMGEGQWRVIAGVEWSPMAYKQQVAPPPPPPPAAEAEPAPPPPAVAEVAPAPAPEPAPPPPAPAAEPNTVVAPAPEPPHEADSDGDGVPDAVDNCPNVKGTSENQGCDTKQNVKIVGGKLVLAGKIEFETGKGTVKESSFPALDEVAALLKAHPEFNHLRIEGHTDSKGNQSKNRQLSKERAESVVQRLVSQGVAGDRLAAVGFGPDKPIADNTTAEGRATNRRVEFVITNSAEESK